jgi:hypothetical protein
MTEGGPGFMVTFFVTVVMQPVAVVVSVTRIHPVPAAPQRTFTDAFVVGPIIVPRGSMVQV